MKMYTKKDLMKAFNCSKTTIDNMRAKGMLDKSKEVLLAGKIQYPQSEVDRVIKESKI